MVMGHSILIIKLILRYFVQVAVGEDSMQLSQVQFQRETLTAAILVIKRQQLVVILTIAIVIIVT